MCYWHITVAIGCINCAQEVQNTASCSKNRLQYLQNGGKTTFIKGFKEIFYVKSIPIIQATKIQGAKTHTPSHRQQYRRALYLKSRQHTQALYAKGYDDIKQSKQH